MVFLPLAIAPAFFTGWYTFRRRTEVPGPDGTSDLPRPVVVWSVGAVIAVLVGLWWIFVLAIFAISATAGWLIGEVAARRRLSQDRPQTR